MKYPKPIRATLNGFVDTSDDLKILWLAVYVQTGGKVYNNARDDNFNPREAKTPTIDSACHIPAKYGAESQNFFIIRNLTPTIDYSTTSNQDMRQGWEYGHTTLYKLNVSDGVIFADTNSRNVRIGNRQIQTLKSLDIVSLANKVLSQFATDIIVTAVAPKLHILKSADVAQVRNNFPHNRPVEETKKKISYSSSSSRQRSLGSDKTSLDRVISDPLGISDPYGVRDPLAYGIRDTLGLNLFD